MKLVGKRLQASNVQNQNANVDEHSFGGRLGEAASAMTKQIALDEKAKHLSHAVHDQLDKPKKERKKPVFKVSDEKKTLFNYILASLKENQGISEENVMVLKENKLIQVQIGDKIFKIDLIQQRPPKS